MHKIFKYFSVDPVGASYILWVWVKVKFETLLRKLKLKSIDDKKRKIQAVISQHNKNIWKTTFNWKNQPYSLLFRDPKGPRKINLMSCVSDNGEDFTDTLKQFMGPNCDFFGQETLNMKQILTTNCNHTFVCETMEGKFEFCDLDYLTAVFKK